MQPHREQLATLAKVQWLVRMTYFRETHLGSSFNDGVKNRGLTGFQHPCFRTHALQIASAECQYQKLVHEVKQWNLYRLNGCFCAVRDFDQCWTDRTFCMQWHDASKHANFNMLVINRTIGRTNVRWLWSRSEVVFPPVYSRRIIGSWPAACGSPDLQAFDQSSPYTYEFMRQNNFVWIEQAS